MRIFILSTVAIAAVFIASPQTLHGQEVAQQSSGLSLAEVEVLAIEQDPLLASITESRLAKDDAAVANMQLPDPRIRVGTLNLPLHSFSYEQEAMTQIQLGVSQSFPRGDTRELRGQQARLQGQQLSKAYDARMISVLFEVRKNWFDALYWQGVVDILANEKQILQELVSVTNAHYRTGERNQQDVIRSQLELSVLQDRKIEAERNYDNALSSLNRWTGVAVGNGNIGRESRELNQPSPRGVIEASLATHPSIGMKDALVAERGVEVSLARQAYKPEWGVDINYGARTRDPLGQNRADFLSVMLNFDVPIFTSERQDKRLSAARRAQQAERLKRDDEIRTLALMLDDAWSNWLRAGQRRALYEGSMLVESHQVYEVTLNAYRNDVSDFSLLIRARIMDLETQLEALAVRTQQSKAQATLLYLQGEK